MASIFFRRLGIATVVFLSLTGCAQKLWYGTNAQRDLYECEMEAARSYAPAMYNTTFGVGYTAPSYTTCNAYGNSANCTTTGGNYVPPAQITLDANDGRRKNHFNYCMVSRGNSYMTKEEAKAQVASSSPVRENSRDRKNAQSNLEMCRDKYSVHYVPEKCK